MYFMLSYFMLFIQSFNLKMFEPTKYLKEIVLNSL